MGCIRSTGSNDVQIEGTFRNFNTIEDFRKVDHKKQLFDETVDRVRPGPRYIDQIPLRPASNLLFLG